jgi:serine/threonine-protein kinase
VLAEKYRVERILGVGGMGFVVAARNIHLGKPVALKMMLPDALAIPLAAERFEREARAAAQLKSEHVAEVLDIGKLPNGAPYIVMELLDGTDFGEVLQRDGWLRIDDLVSYVLQACEAIAEAHALGVVHRDLKPRNLFLGRRLDGTPLVKVLDFGISKWTKIDADSRELTRTSDVIGSPNYMSPEQIRSAKDVDARTDIWSLGVILFELLTGRVPFLADSLTQLCALVLEQPAPPVSTLRADVPAGLVAIVARCLEKPPERRFQTVNELAFALRPFVGPPPQVSAGVAGAPFVATRQSTRRMAVPTPLPSGQPRMPGLRPGDSPNRSGHSPSHGGASTPGGMGDGTGVSWGATFAAGARAHRRVVGAMVLVVPVFVVIAGTGAWFGLGRWAGTTRSAQDAALVESAPSSPLTKAEPPPTVPAMPSTAPLAAASIDPSPSPLVVTTPPLPRTAPKTTHTVDAGRPAATPSLAPARSTTPPPNNDLFTPADRK